MLYRTVFAAALFAFASLGVQAAETYTLDSAHTYPNFTVSHLGFSTMHGRFNQTEGTVVIDREGEASSVDVTIQTASIDTGLEKRDEHLRSDDFFNVAKYPVMTYKSTSVKFTGEDSAIVQGDLTLLGVSKPVPLYVDHIKCGENPVNKKPTCGFNATTTVKRSDFGMTNYLPGVGDEIAIRIEAEATR